ncbi:hypothetical protein SAMN05421789_102284 [Kaistella chaponensis]|uniref:Uncharacterized protein n=1 Tax=Kaistella chaponensis TaxID=713588 RepID=A0A1N7JRG4_9FLAO|nr:hypothetical protein [Kaistella chaponensis]SIS51933.1 hypothetical protein SAMN05421789_102284 [Kaistella chaponensis]
MQRSFWLKFSVFNFLIVALLGVTMRYKILYSMPFLDQKHLQEAHSHFAFYGWITNVIYVLILNYMHKINAQIDLKKYEKLIVVNLIASFTMLGAFLYGGYFWASIAGSTVALLCSFVFFFFFVRDAKKIQDSSKLWFLAGLFFAVISSVGVFNLGYMMMFKTATQDLYLASEYYYLHFQYNGFFIFSCIGFLLFSMKQAGSGISEKQNKLIFWLLFIGCVIGYGLSVLWMKMPVSIFAVIVVATIMQTIGAVLLFVFIKKNWTNLVLKWSAMHRFVLLYAGFAFAVKIALQLGSTIPALNQFAFGFRNVVIAYLHLVLLMCIATFLVNQILATHYFTITNKLLMGFKLLLLGIFLNELILGLMGVFSIKYISIPFANEMLLGVSVLMFASIFWIFLHLKSFKKS